MRLSPSKSIGLAGHRLLLVGLLGLNFFDVGRIHNPDARADGNSMNAKTGTTNVNDSELPQNLGDGSSSNVKSGIHGIHFAEIQDLGEWWDQLSRVYGQKDLVGQLVRLTSADSERDKLSNLLIMKGKADEVPKSLNSLLGSETSTFDAVAYHEAVAEQTIHVAARNKVDEMMKKFSENLKKEFELINKFRSPVADSCGAGRKPSSEELSSIDEGIMSCIFEISTMINLAKGEYSIPKLGYILQTKRQLTSSV